MSDSKKSSSESSSTRWWESYLVRYFTGFIIGTICVILILHYIGMVDYFKNYLSLKDEYGKTKVDWTPFLFISTILGISYCYLVSAPITVLHAGRYLPRNWFSAHARHFWISWAVVILLIIFQSSDLILKLITNQCGLWITLVVGLILSIIIPSEIITQDSNGRYSKSIICAIDKIKLRISGKIASKFNKARADYFLLFVHVAIFVLILIPVINLPSHKDKQTTYFIISFPAIWVGISQYAILISMFMSGDKYIEYYEKLTKARQTNGSKDIRDTYTHLREHSNAIFIVILEISVLALFLKMAGKIDAPKNKTNELPDLTNFGQFLMAAMLFWLIPTMFMWARANFLEREFSDNPQRFINAE